MPVTIGTGENTFANPIGLLSDCHRRIERFLQALLMLINQVEGGFLDAEHQRTLDAALKYFRQAAPKHTADEEEDLFPILRQIASPRVSKIVVQIDRLEGEHKTAATWHCEVEELGQRWLRQDHLSGRETAHLRRLFESLSDLYRAHIAVEEDLVFREFSVTLRSGSGNWAKADYVGFLLAGLTLRNSLSHL